MHGVEMHGVGMELTQGGSNMWACVNLLAGCKYIIALTAVRCTRCGGFCRWSGTSPVQIYTAGGRGGGGFGTCRKDTIILPFLGERSADRVQVL